MTTLDTSRLSTIRAADISELKVLQAPPECVIKIVKAVFILLGYSPDDLTWRHCKRLLNQKGGGYFLNSMVEFEPSMITETALTRAMKELENVNMERVLETSAAAAGLFLWCVRVMLV